MDLQLTLEHERLQQRARTWLARERPADLPHGLDERFSALQDWQRKLYDAGFLGLGWPEAYGGSGGDLLDRIVFNEELAASGAPLPAGLVSLEVVGPTILEYGSEEQRRRFLPPLLRGDEMWCQGFSEPEAGSDLASLRTRAEQAGAGFRLSGQKVWTSWAQYSSWCAVLARTDDQGPKHRGITYFLVRMDEPGITLRPLVQITGDPEFSEMFLDGVPVPEDQVLGEVNGGWRIAMATLGYERGPFALRQQVLIRSALDDLVAEADAAGLLEDPHGFQQLGECEMLVEVLRANGYGTVTGLLAGRHPAESSIDKLFMSRVEQRVHGFALDLLGSLRTAHATGTPLDHSRWIHDYMYSRAATIYGGTSQIQQDIIAHRLLGLPRS